MTTIRTVLSQIGEATGYAEIQAATGLGRMHLRTICSDLRRRGLIERTNAIGPQVEAIFRITTTGRAQLKVDDQLQAYVPNQPLVHAAIERRPALATVWPPISVDHLAAADSMMGALG